MVTCQSLKWGSAAGWRYVRSWLNVISEHRSEMRLRVTWNLVNIVIVNFAVEHTHTHTCDWIESSALSPPQILCWDCSEWMQLLRMLTMTITESWLAVAEVGVPLDKMVQTTNPSNRVHLGYRCGKWQKNTHKDKEQRWPKHQKALMLVTLWVCWLRWTRDKSMMSLYKMESFKVVWVIRAMPRNVCPIVAMKQEVEMLATSFECWLRVITSLLVESRKKTKKIQSIFDPFSFGLLKRRELRFLTTLFRLTNCVFVGFAKHLSRLFCFFCLTLLRQTVEFWGDKLFPIFCENISAPRKLFTQQN